MTYRDISEGFFSEEIEAAKQEAMKDRRGFGARLKMIWENTVIIIIFIFIMQSVYEADPKKAIVCMVGCKCAHT